MFSGAKQAVIGSGLAAQMHLDAGDTLTVAHRPFKIAGVYHIGVAEQDDGAVIPLAAAQVIAVTCRGAAIDEEELVREGKLNATLAVPFVKMLRAQVARVDADASKHVHFGATSQDVLDTAMALCLAESLLECDGFDVGDQVARYRRWQQEGYLSATGQCVGITAGTARALALARWRRQPFSGSHDPRAQDPETLSRVAPVAMYFFARATAAAEQSAEAARTTSQAPRVLAACRALGEALHAALSGESKAAVLALGARADRRYLDRAAAFAGQQFALPGDLRQQGRADGSEPGNTDLQQL